MASKVAHTSLCPPVVFLTSRTVFPKPLDFMNCQYIEKQILFVRSGMWLAVESSQLEIFLKSIYIFPLTII